MLRSLSMRATGLLLAFCACNQNAGRIPIERRLPGVWANVEKSGAEPPGCAEFQYNTTHRRYIFTDSTFSATTARHVHRIGRTVIPAPEGSRCATSVAPVAVEIVARDSGRWAVEGASLRLEGSGGVSRRLAIGMEEGSGGPILRLDTTAFEKE